MPLQPLVDNPRIENLALVGECLDGKTLRFPFPERVRRLAGEVTPEQVAEGLGVALRQPGDQDLWTTAPESYDYNYAVWVQTVEVPRIGRPGTQLWRHLIIRSWGILDVQMGRYYSGAVYGVSTQDPRVTYQIVEERAAQCRRDQEAEQQRLLAAQADADALALLPLIDLEREVRRREAADEEGSSRAVQVLKKRRAEALEASAEVQMVEIRARLVPELTVRIKDTIYEVISVGYREPGGDPMLVWVECWCDQQRVQRSVGTWMTILLRHGEEGVYPKIKVRLKLQELGEWPPSARRAAAEGRSAWVGWRQGVWEDTARKISPKVVGQIIREERQRGAAIQ